MIEWARGNWVETNAPTQVSLTELNTAASHTKIHKAAAL